MGAKVLLFDIDGTLIDCAGAGRRAMEGAFGRLHGRSDALTHLVFGGMTDPAIVREGLRKIGAREEAGDVVAVLDVYLEILAVELPRTPKFRVIDHVVRALEKVHERGHRVGIGTGNLARGAAIKLEHAAIHEHFTFGGYSSDAEDRAQLLARAVERGRALATPDAEVVVIGDTPRDVAAAKAIGASCVAVATGRFSVEQLVEAGAPLAVPDLSDARVWDVL